MLFFFFLLSPWRRVSLVVNSLKPFHWRCEYMNLWLRWKFCQIHQLWTVRIDSHRFLNSFVLNLLKYVFFFFRYQMIDFDWHVRVFYLQLDGQASNVACEDQQMWREQSGPAGWWPGSSQVVWPSSRDRCLAWPNLLIGAIWEAAPLAIQTSSFKCSVAVALLEHGKTSWHVYSWGCVMTSKVRMWWIINPADLDYHVVSFQTMETELGEEVNSERRSNESCLGFWFFFE